MSATHIVYTTKDPKLPVAWHTKQNVCCIYSRVFHCINGLRTYQVYIVPINAEEEPKELTSGKQGAIHFPIFNNKGSKVAWLELDEDGHESDRYARFLRVMLSIDIVNQG